jgi:tRNA pseudouridine38-40 synthase
MRLLAIAEYDGTDFQGFQVQVRKRTIQGELEKALFQITGERIRVIGAGRTDTGVHATGQVVHFDTDWNRQPSILQRALNAVLPKDVAISLLSFAPPGFSARYSALSRTYRYVILNQPVRAPLSAKYALTVKEILDAEAMNEGARVLIGRQDFGSFGTSPRGENTVREVYRAQVFREGKRVTFEIEATAFLYRMVRRIVGTLILVGKGALSLDQFRQVLAGEQRAGQSVPPQGLCLIAVNYGVMEKDENIQHQADRY